MARRKITIVKEDAPEIPDAQIITQETPEEEDAGLTLPEKLREILAEDSSSTYYTRVYRCEAAGGADGDKKYIGRVEDIIDEEYIANRWGGGRYFVRYSYRLKGVNKNTSKYYTISPEYEKPANTLQRVQAAGAQQSPVSAFLSDLTVEKVLAITTAVAKIRELFRPSVDMTEILKAAIANKSQSVGDAVVMEAIKGSQKPQQNILEQVKQLQEVKKIITEDRPEIPEEDEDENENKGGLMDYVKMGLSMLPQLLKQNGGSYEAAGQAVKENPYIQDLLAKNPNLATQFITAARDEYGDEKAKQLARGFGYEANFQEPTQLTNDATPEAAAQGA